MLFRSEGGREEGERKEVIISEDLRKGRRERERGKEGGRSVERWET